MERYALYYELVFIISNPPGLNLIHSFLKPMNIPSIRTLIFLSPLLTQASLTAAELMRPVVVTASHAPLGQLEEEKPSGAWAQPEWVQSRRFTTTRVYIQRSPGEVSLEQWWRGRVYDGKVSNLFQEEVEIGLPWRMQLDLYQDWTVEDRKSDYLDFAAELRYGLADWGVIPLNPALYLEYKWTDPSRGGDVIEPKLLLGTELAPRVHYGVNIVYERELSGDEQAEEWQVTQGLSYTVIDQKFSVGVEMKYINETTIETRGTPEHKVLLGPSIQWLPTRNSHLDLVALAGLTKESPDLEAYVVFGIDFDWGHHGQSRKVDGPVSGMR
jgi:hypothetical protein